MQNIPINPHVTPTECHTENSPNVTSGSSQFHSQLEDLKSLPVPYNELYHTLSSYNNIPIRILCDRIRKATTEIEAWLEAAKSALFGLEVEVKQDGVKAYKQDVNEIEMITSRFYPNVEMMLELNSKVGSKLDSHADQDQSNTDESAESKGPLLSTEELQQIVKAIHSSWLSLKAMLDEIRGIFAIAQTRREILTHMEDILVEIEQIGLVTDKLQEERSRQTSEAVGSEHGKTSSSLSNSISTHSTDTTMNTDTSKEKNRNTEVLAGIDSRIEALKPRVERLTMQVERLPSLDFKCDELQDQYDELLRLWDDAKTRREKIGDEIKEERWLAVFGQVAGQVESMMESLDRAIVHCKGLVDQIKVMVKDEVVPTAPIDRDHLYTIFKSFESKHKYYAPAVTKMLNMLENGIQNRATKNADAIQKHKDMKAKWEKLQGSLDLVELDLDGIEAMLDQLDASIPSSHIVTPPAQLPEKPLFAMRQSQIQSELKSPGPPVLFEPSPQDQEPQRGRQPFPSPVPSRSSAESSEPTSRTRNRSPPSGQPRQRPWSPTPSVASQSSMLSPSMFGSRRSFSRSPSRSPSRATSDKLRPWCPRLS
ncbi:hypothetical protein BCR41DRAFT_178141 [Lobosporangium transversale]|uniref:Karyogamy protein n=1 Tax=Lobosporangium transversale TaxID=64571 RepID=A0A1Y2GX92_9FUNG|nr:hypothetical protein BCR41DRAFT_178141 [Lobosporangium transversale]ORZ26899.1 hypothetical protein BCR41DRAFT_178141 [Lobosporangium transversale]|eukprot:XP_021884646.1 hypothetical protein BCR41DRAFT_178141 [Lobosporangium transversale]